MRRLWILSFGALFGSISIPSQSQAEETLRAGAIFSTTQATSQSFLRFHNTAAVAGRVTAVLRDPATGNELGRWTSPLLSPGAEQQYFIGTVENEATPPISNKPAYYAIGLEASAGLAGYFQHVLFRPADGTLTNLSTCSGGVTAGGSQVSGVHSSRVGTNFPSLIAITNTGATAAAATLGIHDARNGLRLGGYTSAAIPAGGQATVSVTAIEAAASIAPTSAQLHYVARIEGAFGGYLQHTVNNVQRGVITDMTTVCALSGVASAAPSPSPQAGSISSSTQSAAQSFLRLHNTGPNAGTAAVTLRNAASGQTLAQWTSPSIPAGAERQFFIGTVETDADRAFTKPANYVVSVESRFTGSFQHVLFRPADGTLTNLSTCDAGIRSDIAQVSGVHSSRLGVNYPSAVVVNNTGTAAMTARLAVHDANTGARLGTYTTAAIAAGGHAIVPVTEIEAATGLAPTAAQLHYVIRAEGVFAGFLQHLVDNRLVGVITDMTTACALPARPSGTTLTYVASTTRKLEQLIGDCDREIEARNNTCQATASRTATRFNVGGTDLGQSFEDNGRMIFLFGDTLSGNSVAFVGRDVFARSTATDPEAPTVLDFFTRSDGSPLFVAPPSVNMTGGFNVPDAGISLSDGIYLFLHAGAQTTLPDPFVNARSVIARFNETAQTFTELRTVSRRADSGKFLNVTLHKHGTDVLMFGIGRYREDNAYLARTPQASYATGAGTMYFTGLVSGQPTWSANEADAVPVIEDNPLNGPSHPNGRPTIGNVSVAFHAGLNLWLMTFDGGRQTMETGGIYFSYASQPWGPWSTPQLIFNPVRDGAYGVYIHDPRITPNPPGDRLQGPFIGSTDRDATPGGPYAPFMIERFNTVSGNTLRIYYTVSTWNPYVVLKMRSELAIGSIP